MRDPRKLKSLYQVELDERQVAFLFIGSLAALLIVFSLGVMLGWQLRAIDHETRLVARLSGAAKGILDPFREPEVSDPEADPLRLVPPPASLGEGETPEEERGESTSEDAETADAQASSSAVASEPVPPSVAVADAEEVIVPPPSVEEPVSISRLSPRADGPIEETQENFEEESLPALPLSAEGEEDTWEGEGDGEQTAIPPAAAPPIPPEKAAAMGPLYTVQIAAYRSLDDALTRVE
ncbi:MAG: hypothetical protein D6795_07775, partial [Deltaproteobacteria bacterium]